MLFPKGLFPLTKEGETMVMLTKLFCQWFSIILVVHGLIQNKLML